MYSILTRIEKENLIKIFFGDGATDIIGIVRKNASGNAIFSELIQYVSDDANTIINKPFFAGLNDGKDEETILGISHN